MRQSGFMVKKQNLSPLLSFSALLVCILPHYRLRDWRGNLRKASGHVVCRLDQSALFRIFDSTFYFPHSAIPHFTHGLSHKLFCSTDDVQSLSLPGTYHEKIGCLGDSVKHFTRLKLLDLSRNCLESLAVSRWRDHA